MPRRLLVALFCLLAVKSVQAAAPAETPTDNPLDQQLQRLQTTLQDQERSATHWWKTWTVLYGAATVVQGGVAIVSTDKSTRQDMIVGAGTTLLGVASQLITPVETHFTALGADSIAKLTFLEKQALLTKGEEYLKKQADIAVAGKSWQVHALSGAVNLASGLITWLGFKRSFGEGALNFALNTVVTETQIWTQPVRAKKAYERYLLDKNRGFATPSNNCPEWYGQVSPASCSFGLRF